MEEIQSNPTISIVQAIPPLVDPQSIQQFVDLFEVLQPILESAIKEDEDELTDNEQYKETNYDDDEGLVEHDF